MKTVIVYGSTTGTTEGIALDLESFFEGSMVLPSISVSEEMLRDCDLLILGASTWGMGDLQDDMISFLELFSQWNVQIPFGAVFGLGDQISYSNTFVDGIAEMASALKSKKIKLVGKCSSDGYNFLESRAQSEGYFLGLPLDQDNESEKTGDRLEKWIKQIKEEVEL